MAENKFLPFADNAIEGQNIESQIEYEGSNARMGGVNTGVASASQYNKAMKQSAKMTSAVGQLIADNVESTEDITDKMSSQELANKLKECILNISPIPPYADTLDEGVIRIATDEEVAAGKSETVAVNPKQLKEFGTPIETVNNIAPDSTKNIDLGNLVSYKGGRLIARDGQTFATTETPINIDTETNGLLPTSRISGLDDKLAELEENVGGIIGDLNLSTIDGVLPVTKGGTGVAVDVLSNTGTVPQENFFQQVLGATLVIPDDQLKTNIFYPKSSVIPVDKTKESGSFTKAPYRFGVLAGNDKVDLTKGVFGTLPVANGGTGSTSFIIDNSLLSMKNGSLSYGTPTGTVLTDYFINVIANSQNLGGSRNGNWYVAYNKIQRNYAPGALCIVMFSGCIKPSSTINTTIIIVDFVCPDNYIINKIITGGCGIYCNGVAMSCDTLSFESVGSPVRTKVRFRSSATTTQIAISPTHAFTFNGFVLMNQM